MFSLRKNKTNIIKKQIINQQENCLDDTIDQSKNRSASSLIKKQQKETISATTKYNHEYLLNNHDENDKNNNNENNNDNNHVDDDDDDEFYHSDFGKDSPHETDGRISGGSRESAFSSAPSDESDSSKNLSSLNDLNHNPTSTSRFSPVSSMISDCDVDYLESKEKIALLLKIVIDSFFKFAKIDISNRSALEQYDKLDLEALLEPLDLTRIEYHMAYKLTIRFIHHLRLSTEFASLESLNNGTFLKQNQDYITKVCENLSDLLKFRKFYELNHATLEQFPLEFLKLNGIFTFGHDKNNIPVLYISAHVHRKWSPKLDELFKRYVAWHVNRVTGSTLNTTEKMGHFVMCFDCNSIGYSNIDLEFLKFLVQLLLNYYPRSCKLCLIKDNPWVFRSVWSMAKSWLTEEARNAVELITAKQLTDFIPEDQIPNSMKTTNFPSQSSRLESGRFTFPSNFKDMRSIDEFAKDLDLNQDEIRKLKLHVDKIQQEYKSLGAIA